ncbi:MAG: glycoside hydrolase family 57 [Lentisphaeria bacterium]|nr:MAG: glycoside hydrolase family 57 [Lentisphaeria bacterium]
MSKKPQIIFMPHANIQYSQLDPARRAWVCENCYRPLFELVRDGDYRIAFEASGRTLEVMHDEAPAVLDLLSGLIREGKIEPIGSPFIHVMLTNIPPEIGVDTLRHGLDAWEKYTGVRPETGWNPECGWAGWLPRRLSGSGLQIAGDGCRQLLSLLPGNPRSDGLKYDVQGHSNKNHLFKIEEYIKEKPEFLRYLTNPSVAPNGLKMIFRSDCMANPMLWYLMGATEGMRKDPVSLDEIREMFLKWQPRIAKSGSFIMPYAEDAEYIGSSAYFYVKQFNQARFFEPEPASVNRFRELLDMAKEVGYELSTPADVIRSAETVIENDLIENIENGAAWHGGTAKAWANTSYSRILDPVCRSIFDGVVALRKRLGNTPELEKAMKAVTSAYVSDSRWPPLPTSPGRFNVRETLDDLYLANRMLEEAMAKGGIAEKRAIYSAPLMLTQIRLIEQILMEQKYFGE